MMRTPSGWSQNILRTAMSAIIYTIVQPSTLNSFSPLATQWLANRGYAVLQVNFRGSIGFGKAFLNAGDHQLGLAMEDDLIDGVKWAISQGIADPKRIAVMGVSGGGYATLRGVSRYPDLFVCGVDLVGPSDLKLLFATIDRKSTRL